MPNRNHRGLDWRSDELDAIIADYFGMLAEDLAKQRYSKAAHNAKLRGQIRRSRGSVEFKHQNISAVLERLGMPWIAGYKPREHFQATMLRAIEQYLLQHPEILEFVPRAEQIDPDSDRLFVMPPPRSGAPHLDEPMHRLIQKFDPVERDRQNHALGRAGEEFVFKVEKQRLVEAGRKDLSRKVRWVANDEGDGHGYDVLSFDPSGEQRLLEVKTTNGAARTPFFLTRNEFAESRKRPAQWRIYRVHRFAQQPRIFTLGPPLEDSLKLQEELWRASFG